MSSQMEMLSNNFNSLLTQYKDTYQNFLNTINSGNNSLTSVPNSAFIGQSNINTIQGSSVDNCLSECTSNQTCSGATFDNNLNTCTLSSGTGNIVSSKNQTAIVKQALYYTNQLQEINNKLMDINTSMMNLANSSMSDYSQTQQQNNEKAELLNKNYQTLEQERVEIAEMVREYETLNSALENGSINATSNYYNFIMYFLIAVFLVFILFKINLTGEQRGGGTGKSPILLFVFLMIIIIFNAYLKN
jgi:hypothetical protein